jgi:uncharacterized protein YbjT (DUF2867 family)
MTTAKRVAVAGATGRVGRHVVDVLQERGIDPVPISRSAGVDVITGEGLVDALRGVDYIIDVATGPSPEEQPATEFFETATRNLQRAGSEAGVRGIVVVSIIGIDRFSGGYQAAKVAHERAMLAGPIPVRILRAAQFHEFVAQLLEWGTRGEVGYVPSMSTQLVAARAVAEELVGLAVAFEPEPDGGRHPLEIAGPRAENLVDIARLLVERSGEQLRVERWSDPNDPDHELLENGTLLPGPGAILAGPTFEQWLDESEMARGS